MIETGHVSRMKEKCIMGVDRGNLEERDHLEDLGVELSITVK